MTLYHRLRVFYRFFVQQHALKYVKKLNITLQKTNYIYLSDKIIILGLRDNINNKGLCKWEIIIFRRTEKETVILLKGL